MDDFKIVRKRMVPYVETIKCDCCDVELEQESFVSLSNPPIFHYTCPECGKKFISNINYPRTVWVEEQNFAKNSVKKLDGVLFVWYNKVKFKGVEIDTFKESRG